MLQCDDGNMEDLDGCSSVCTIEKGYVCSHQNNDADKCIDSVNPTFKAYIANNSGTVIVKFSKKVSYFPDITNSIKIESETHQFCTLQISSYDTFPKNAGYITRLSIYTTPNCSILKNEVWP